DKRKIKNYFKKFLANKNRAGDCPVLVRSFPKHNNPAHCFRERNYEAARKRNANKRAKAKSARFGVRTRQRQIIPLGTVKSTGNVPPRMAQGHFDLKFPPTPRK
ncbi:MAG: hypothetical protein OSJ58_17200, partial [Dysosmobacter sp.]|nr:hypothetical protein [Dysosmobacter sp.]